MHYNVSIVHGGTFENVEAPLSIDATSFQGIISAVEEIAGLKDMKISHRGKILKPTDRLPADGAILFVSGSTPKQEEMEVEFPVVTQEEMNNAKNLIKTYGSSRNPIRHDFNTLASEMMRSVYKNYPKLAKKDPIGAQICVSAGKADGSLFIDCLNKELYKKHPLIQYVLMEIAKKTRESAAFFAKKAGVDPAIMPQILAHSAPRAGLPRQANPAAQRAAARGEQIIRISQITNRQKLARIRRKLKLAHPSMKAQLARLRSPKICSLRLSLVHYKTHCLLLTQTLLLLLLLRGLVSIIRPVKRRTL